MFFNLFKTKKKKWNLHISVKEKLKSELIERVSWNVVFNSLTNKEMVLLF